MPTITINPQRSVLNVCCVHSLQLFDLPIVEMLEKDQLLHPPIEEILFLLGQTDSRVVKTFETWFG